MTIGTEEGRSITRETWKDAQYEYASNGDLLYRGVSTIHSASESDGLLWYIWKYTWSSGTLVRTEGPLNGNWDDRATLGWV